MNQKFLEDKVEFVSKFAELCGCKTHRSIKKFIKVTFVLLTLTVLSVVFFIYFFIKHMLGIKKG